MVLVRPSSGGSVVVQVEVSVWQARSWSAVLRADLCGQETISQDTPGKNSCPQHASTTWPHTYIKCGHVIIHGLSSQSWVNMATKGYSHFHYHSKQLLKGQWNKVRIHFSSHMFVQCTGIHILTTYVIFHFSVLMDWLISKSYIFSRFGMTL